MWIRIAVLNIISYWNSSKEPQNISYTHKQNPDFITIMYDVSIKNVALNLTMPIYLAFKNIKVLELRICIVHNKEIETKRIIFYL